MKLFKKILCISIALVMLMGSLVACKNDGGESEDSETVSTQGEWVLDFSDKNYNNADFRVLRSNVEKVHGLTGHPNDFYIEELGADLLANAVYTRNQKLYEMLSVNVTLEHANNGSVLIDTVSKNIMTGDEPYDLIAVEMCNVGALASQQLIKDIQELDMDTSYSWWDKQAESTFTIGGKQFAMISDITFFDKLCTVAVFYNTHIGDNLKLPNIYEMVDNGTWTVEKMKEFAIMATDSGENIWGLSSQRDYSYYFLHSAGLTTVANNSAGELRYRLVDTRSVDVMQDAFEIMNEPYFFNRQAEKLSVEEACENFVNNLFLVRPIQSFYYLKNLFDYYGVLPMPRYDDVNEGYYSPVNHYTLTVMSIPLNNNENERTSDVLQAWSMISEKDVQGLFYDTILSARMVQDEDSKRMLDVIFEKRVYDIGLAFGIVPQGIVFFTTEAAIERAPGAIGSILASKKSLVNGNITNFIAEIQKSSN